MGLSRAQIEVELRNMLLNIIDVDPEDLKPQSHFFKDLGVDSIKAIEIAVAIEKHFKISFPESEIVNVTTFQNGVDLIEKELNER